jgi:DNA-binding GntR family transcriptional regulator
MSTTCVGYNTGRDAARPGAEAPMNKLQIKSVSVIEALAKSLRDRVLRGELTPDTPLPELQLANQYGVARPTIRAAIQQLTLTGLLRREANRSAFVPRLSDDEIRDLYGVRAVLELEVVRRITEQHLRPAQAEAALRRLEQFGDDANWNEVVDADIDFHVALVEASGSRHISHLYGLLGDEIRLCVAQLRPAYDSVAKLAGEHRELLAAIEQGDVDAAVGLMREHLDKAVGDLTDRRTKGASRSRRAASAPQPHVRTAARTGRTGRRSHV